MVFTNRLFYGLFAAAVVVALGVFSLEMFYLGLAIAFSLILLAIVDYATIPSQRQIHAERKIPLKLSLGSIQRVSIVVTNTSQYNLQLTVQDEPPDELEMREVVFKKKIPARGQAELEYNIRPLERGAYQFHRINIRCRGIHFGLTEKWFRYKSGQEVRIYPDFKQLQQYDLMLKREWLEIGLRRSRRYGTGTEYESLREYNQDDSFRNISWKATAKYGTPIVMQYQLERSQHLLIMIDAGRLMGSEVQGMSKLNLAINAALMLSYTALRHEDNVGLLVFSRGIQCYLPPRKNLSQMRRISEALYDVRSELVESNYSGAFEFLRHRQKRRSLIVLFSEVLDQYASESLISQMSSLHPKHLGLCVTMKDQELSGILMQGVSDSDQAFRKAVTAELLTERHEVIASLKSRGVRIVDVLPQDLTSGVLQNYLEVKSKSLL